MNVSSLIDTAIKLSGSQSKLGKLCGVSQHAIWAARRSNRVSAELAVAIERATDGAVTKFQLRPDIFDAAQSPAMSQERN